MQKTITTNQLSELKNWFETYTHTFRRGDEKFQKNIVLKIDHTKRVCREIQALGEAVGLAEQVLRIAQTAALFHDIGRFEQYARHGTFMDRKSEDHARLGVRILKEHGVFNHLDEKTARLVLRAVLYHNRMALPGHETGACLLLTKLLRDADKLDIWKVVTDYYHEDAGRNGTLELDLPDTPGFSEAVGRDLLDRRIVNMAHVRNLNDFKLLQISWVYDINFRQTFACIQSRGYVDLIARALPESDDIAETVRSVRQYLHEQTQSQHRG